MKTGASLETCTEQELLRIKRDNFDIGSYCILTDSFDVSLSEQTPGDFRAAEITIPRNVFNRLIKQYQKQQRFIRKAP